MLLATNWNVNFIGFFMVSITDGLVIGFTALHWAQENGRDVLNSFSTASRLKPKGKAMLRNSLRQSSRMRLRSPLSPPSISPTLLPSR